MENSNKYSHEKKKSDFRVSKSTFNISQLERESEISNSDYDHIDQILSSSMYKKSNRKISEKVKSISKSTSSTNIQKPIKTPS